MVSPYLSRGQLALRQLAELEHGHHLQVCREILAGPDRPGRRWLIGVLRGDPPVQEHGMAKPVCQGLLLPVINRLREQLKTEFPSLFLKEQE